MRKNVAQQVYNVVAKECGCPRESINAQTLFVANKNFTHFEIDNILYDLQHMFEVKLPESDYNKYNDIKGLTRSIVNQLKGKRK